MLSEVNELDYNTLFSKKKGEEQHMQIKQGGGVMQAIKSEDQKKK